MKTLTKILLFAAVNILGLLTIPLCYFAGQFSGLISLSQPAFDAASFKHQFFTGMPLTWLVCAVFSLAYFFLNGKERLLFLWAPVFIPAGYGFSLLAGLLS